MRTLILALVPLLLTAPSVAAERPAPKGNAAAAIADPDKVVCKRAVEIGSLVASKKTCLTKREWADRRVAAQDDTRRMQDSVGGPQ